MKKITKLSTLLLSALLLVSLTGCGKEIDKTPAVEYINQFFNEFKAGNFKEASSMTEDPEFINFTVEDNPVFSVKSQESAISMMKEFDYKILKETTSNGIVELEIEFTLNNVGERYTEGMRSAVMANLSGMEESKSEDELVIEMSTAFESAFEKKPSTHKETIFVELIEDEDSFVIIPTGDLLNMLMGNLLRAQQELSQVMYAE